MHWFYLAGAWYYLRLCPQTTLIATPQVMGGPVRTLALILPGFRGRALEKFVGSGGRGLEKSKGFGERALGNSTGFGQ